MGKTGCGLEVRFGIKSNSRPQKGRFRQQAEFIIGGSNGKLDIKRDVPILSGVFRYSNVVRKEKASPNAKADRTHERCG